jgi:hypothetical protein
MTSKLLAKNDDQIGGDTAISYVKKGAGSRYFCESLFWASLPKQAAKT